MQIVISAHFQSKIRTELQVLHFDFVNIDFLNIVIKFTKRIISKFKYKNSLDVRNDSLSINNINKWL